MDNEGPGGVVQFIKRSVLGFSTQVLGMSSVGTGSNWSTVVDWSRPPASARSPGVADSSPLVSREGWDEERLRCADQTDQMGDLDQPLAIIMPSRAICQTWKVSAMLDENHAICMKTGRFGRFWRFGGEIDLADKYTPGIHVLLRFWPRIGSLKTSS